MNSGTWSAALLLCPLAIPANADAVDDAPGKVFTTLQECRSAHPVPDRSFSGSGNAAQRLVGMRWRFSTHATWSTELYREEGSTQGEFEISDKWRGPLCEPALIGRGTATVAYRHIHAFDPSCSYQDDSGAKTLPLAIAGNAGPERFLFQPLVLPKDYPTWVSSCGAQQISRHTEDLRMTVGYADYYPYASVDRERNQASGAPNWSIRTTMTPECELDTRAEQIQVVIEPFSTAVEETPSENSRPRGATARRSPPASPPGPISGRFDIYSTGKPAQFGTRTCIGVDKVRVTPLERLTLAAQSTCDGEKLKNRRAEIARQATLRFEPWFRSAVLEAGLPSSGLPRAVENPQAMESALKKQVDKALKPVLNALQAALLHDYAELERAAAAACRRR
jgi:hypothetical protein